MTRIPKIRSIKEDTLSRKILLSFVLMSLIPILLMLYIVYFVAPPSQESQMEVVRLIIFWIVCISLAGFWVSKGIVKSILTVTHNARAIASGEFSREVEIDSKDEISDLAMAFNRITHQLEEKIEELTEFKQVLQTVLSKIGQAVSSFQDIDRFLELIIETMRDALEAEEGSLLLMDTQKSELWTKIGREKKRVKIGEGVIGTVAREGKPLMVPMVTGRSGSILCVPLTYRNKILGVVSLENKRRGRNFNQDDLVLLSDLATQLALAIENQKLSEDAEKTYIETITALAMAVEAKDPYTRGHSKRVGEYVSRLAERFNLSPDLTKMLKDAAVLHDIGKIGIPDNILCKPSAPTEEECKLIQEHPVIGEGIMKPVRSLVGLCDLARHHHERMDGSGYPDGLKGEEMSLPLRILIVADAFDAMTSDRPYRKALSIEKAKAELKREMGVHFDKDVVEAFLEIF